MFFVAQCERLVDPGYTVFFSLLPFRCIQRARVKVFLTRFVEGAKGIRVDSQDLPFLVTMLVAIGMFKGAGGIDLLSRLLFKTNS